MGKEQFRESDLARKVVGVKFMPADSDFMRQAAHIRVINNRLYEDLPGKWVPAQCGPLDLRLGTISKHGQCKTCGRNLTDCVGHFGYIDLDFPVFHVGFFKLTIQVLQCICKSCSGLLLSDEQRAHYLRQVSNPNLDYLRRKALHKNIVAACKKTNPCPKCGQRNGLVKKAMGTVLKIVYAHGVTEDKMREFATATEANSDLSATLFKSKFTLLNPLRVQKLFNNVPTEDIPILMAKSGEKKHPNDLLLTRIPVPPVCVRPSVVSEVKSGTTEDDLTMKLSEIILINDVLQKHKKDGAPMKTVSETWDHLQIQVALYFNSELSGLPPDLQPKKALRGFTQRLKGKQGRFRGNLSGKRVDFSGRTVISPDPNLRIDEVGVPVHIALILTFPEVVNNYNMERMKKLIMTGSDNHPGANYVVDRVTGTKRLLKYGNRETCAASLKVGDIVERHLDDGDIVLFNRQPSLHKVSIMSHRARIVPGRTFRFNECACTPYNADFDGDEMNLHVPQTYEARAEASLLMGVKSNLITPRSGEPLIAAIQDFITGAYLMTHKDTFFTFSEATRMAASIIDCYSKKQKRIRLPVPAIWKPAKLWTGKQLMELIISDDFKNPKKLNLTTPNKSYTTNREFCVKDSFVIFRNGQLISGVLDKSLLGSSSKTNIFYILLRDFGEDAAVDAMWRLARMMPTFLTNRGFSIGIGDVHPSAQLLKEKQALLNDGYKKCHEYIAQLKSGQLKAQPGCTDEETLEALILRELSSIRDKAGKACVDNLSKHNAPLTMAVCGSKGSFINISQMIACVGQQAISGHRPPDGFDKRSLPHFEKLQKTPEAKGFVENSFFSGLNPTEFFFHTMGGREGLVDTAVKTAETGYMQRRLVKCLEDLCASYDGTVRSSVGDIVEFIFGEDGLDPALMEAKNGSVLDFAHQLEHVRNTHPFNGDEELDKTDMEALSKTILDKELNGSHSYFRTQLEEFISEVIKRTSTIYGIPEFCSTHPKGIPPNRTGKCAQCLSQQKYRSAQVHAHCVSHSQFVAFLEACCLKLKKAVVEPGTAVGAIAATSIGEPSTQMTLKTFHFAGVASMNITQGVPRIKEIINAVKIISTPIITAQLIDSRDEKLARQVKARIDVTTLGEICDYIEEVNMPDNTFLLLKLSSKRIRILHLEVTMMSIVQSILSTKSFVPFKLAQITIVGKSMMVIRPPPESKFSKAITVQIMKQTLQRVIVKGLPNVRRCVIHADEKRGDEYSVIVEGSDFRGVLSQPGIDGRFTNFNNALVVAEVLGIEAARTCIINEIIGTMEAHGIGLDRRHVMLLADVMTYRGEVLGITRNGLVKMKESVLLLASFEKTMDHLFEAAFFSQKDPIHGVSECIILGIPISIGTGMFKLHQKLSEPIDYSPGDPIFMKPEFRLKGLSGTILSLLQLFTLYYVLCVLLGAPVFSEFYSTSALSLWLALLTGLPISFVYRSASQIREFLFEGRCSTHSELSAHRAILGAVIGAWLGAFVIPLDWDRWWQRYPLPNFVGSGFAIKSMPSENGSLPLEGLFGQYRFADVPKLKAIFYAEFDIDIGPVIRYQIPEDQTVVSTERFSAFSAAIIPKDEMLNRLIKLNFRDYKVMGHPIGLKHETWYGRGQLNFNMCFVVAKESTIDCMYEPLVQKFAEYLVDLEMECGFLHIPETRAQLPTIMRQVFTDLNTCGECVFPVTELTTLYLKLCPSYRGVEPPKVSLYMVPMFIRATQLSPAVIDKMDVLSQKIIPKIDGIRCVKEIATEVEIDADLVMRCVRNLHFYECVSLVPLFLYSNTYVATEKLHEFYNNPSEIEDCLEFVRHRLPDGELGPVPQFCDVFRLLMSLKCGSTLRDWCDAMSPRRYNVDERRLVQFGMHHQFLRKLSTYPISTVPSSEVERSGK
ncbi:DNA-directed RNA polymerase subunit [Trichostrongylus colubriformis]|uniref:DNA-directed RNA polymerase subunit n=1 Tax=Trichostrongylus colubriformis TaxID=6319 RepID=A0AAN8FKP4_TRICO